MGNLDRRLVDILVCPICKAPLHYKNDADELVCGADRVAFPVKDGIPVMLEEEARQLKPDEEV